jgi:hypothetical protein
MPEIPYPAVFRDWRNRNERVATAYGQAGVLVEMYLGDGTWKQVELTEEDACLMAARMLRAAGRKKLSRKVLAKLGENS